MPSLHDTALYLDTMGDALAAKEWWETGSLLGAKALRVAAFERAVAELGSKDAAKMLLDQVEREVRFDQYIIENL